MSDPKPWTCPACQNQQERAPETICPLCLTPLYATWAIMVAHHVLEHIQDGLATPLEILEAMSARPCYKNTRLELQFIAQQIRLLTKSTKSLARELFEARAAVMALNVVNNGDTKDHLQALKGIQVLGDVVEHKVDAVTRHVVELHEGPPPKS